MRCGSGRANKFEPGVARRRIRGRPAKTGRAHCVRVRVDELGHSFSRLLVAQPPHTRLLTTAARQILRPLGLHQRGRSRLWLDDHGWWATIVEFTPANSGRGSFLNVAATWLWREKDSLSFDYKFSSDY